MLYEHVLPKMREGQWATLPGKPKITIRNNYLVDQEGIPIPHSEDLLSDEWYLAPASNELGTLKRAKREIDKLISKSFRPEWLTPELGEISFFLDGAIKEFEKND